MGGITQIVGVSKLWVIQIVGYPDCHVGVSRLSCGGIQIRDIDILWGYLYCRGIHTMEYPYCEYIQIVGGILIAGMDRLWGIQIRASGLDRLWGDTDCGVNPDCGVSRMWGHPDCGGIQMRGMYRLWGIQIKASGLE